MSALVPNAAKGLLFASSEPHRAYEVVRYLIEQAQRIVAIVINEAYKKDDALKDTVQDLVASGKLFGTYENGGPVGRKRFIWCWPHSCSYNRSRNW